jgi:hypothetical protein
MDTPSPHTHRRARVVLPNATSTPTRSSRRASSPPPRAPAWASTLQRLALARRWLAEPGVSLQPAAQRRDAASSGRTQLRLRLLARTRAVGADRPRPARRDQQPDRRHLPQQRAEERPAAHRAGRGGRAGLLMQRPDDVLRIDVASCRTATPDGAASTSLWTPSRAPACSKAWTSWATCWPVGTPSPPTNTAANRNSLMQADIVVLPGDGIGPEVTAPRCACCKADRAAVRP